MEFQWPEEHPGLNGLTPRDVEESFEDPFSIRFLPDQDDDSQSARYYSLGKSVANQPIFSVFWTDGKHFRVITAREMTDAEHTFYERKNAEFY